MFKKFYKLVKILRIISFLKLLLSQCKSIDAAFGENFKFLEIFILGLWLNN